MFLQSSEYFHGIKQLWKPTLSYEDKIINLF